jgi:YD repeat-containing protein
MMPPTEHLDQKMEDASMTDTKPGLIACGDLRLYDDRGNLIWFEDRSQNFWAEYEYDDKNNLVRYHNSKGKTFFYKWENGQQLAITKDEFEGENK